MISAEVRKSELIEARNERGFSQECMAAFLEMDVSSYSRKENGRIKMAYKEWQKLAEILGIPLEDIYESDENITVVFKGNSSGVGNIFGDNVTNYTIPQSIWESQKKYIERLEEENRDLKEEVLLLKGKAP